MPNGIDRVCSILLSNPFNLLIKSNRRVVLSQYTSELVEKLNSEYKSEERIYCVLFLDDEIELLANKQFNAAMALMIADLEEAVRLYVLQETRYIERGRKGNPQYFRLDDLASELVTTKGNDDLRILLNEVEKYRNAYVHRNNAAYMQLLFPSQGDDNKRQYEKDEWMWMPIGNNMADSIKLFIDCSRKVTAIYYILYHKRASREHKLLDVIHYRLNRMEHKTLYGKFVKAIFDFSSECDV